MAVFLLYLLLVPLALPPVLSVPTYQDFEKRHMHKVEGLVDCDTHMKKVNEDYFKFKGKCKPLNTIILGDDRGKTNEGDVKKICEGTKDDDFQTSKKQFQVIDCVLVSGDKKDNCKYNSKSKNVYIIVKCVGEEPVHFHGQVK